MEFAQTVLGYLTATDNNDGTVTSNLCSSSSCGVCSTTLTATYGNCVAIPNTSYYGTAWPITKNSLAVSTFSDSSCSKAISGVSIGTYGTNTCSLAPAGVNTLVGSSSYIDAGILKPTGTAALSLAAFEICSNSGCATCSFAGVASLGDCFLSNPGASPSVYAIVKSVSMLTVTFSVVFAAVLSTLFLSI